MITVEQLRAKNYPQEYWVNVYADHTGRSDHIIGFRHSTKESLEALTRVILKGKPLYRIHVRLK